MAVVPLIVVWKYKYLQTPKTKALTDKSLKQQLHGQEPFHLRVFHWQSQFSWVMCTPFIANGMLVKSLESLSVYASKEGGEQNERMEDRFS